MSNVLVERRGAVTIVTLNRPERRNALSAQLRGELEAAVAEFDSDAAQRVAVLAANGPIFCAGADLRELSERSRGDAHAPETQSTTMVVGDSLKPWIAAIDAPALAGGLETVLNCDIRIAAAHVWFSLPEVALGMIPGTAVNQLVRQIGYSDAMHLLLTNERIDAGTALRMGLVQEVVPTDARSRATELATRLAAFEPGPVQGAKAIARRWRDHDLAAMVEFYLSVNAAQTTSTAMIERVGEFFDGRSG
jgi:enoyl-CoA hydratase/carnithine racemase